MNPITPLLAIAFFVACGAFAAQFESPVRLSADGKPIQVERPGYAFPAWADLDGDGKMELLVGQFAGGKIQIFKSLGDGKFAAGKFLEINGKVAQVPGVW